MIFFNWTEAARKARAGVPVRRYGWSDRWLAYKTGNLWQIQPHITAEGVSLIANSRVVQAFDFGEEEFLSDDWTEAPPEENNACARPAQPAFIPPGIHFSAIEHEGNIRLTTSLGTSSLPGAYWLRFRINGSLVATREVTANGTIRIDVPRTEALAYECQLDAESALPLPQWTAVRQSSVTLPALPVCPIAVITEPPVGHHLVLSFSELMELWATPTIQVRSETIAQVPGNTRIQSGLEVSTPLWAPPIDSSTRPCGPTSRTVGQGNGNLGEIGWVSHVSIGATLTLRFNEIKRLGPTYYLPVDFTVGFSTTLDHSPYEPGNPDMHNTGRAAYSLGPFTFPADPDRTDFSWPEYGGSGHYMTDVMYGYPAPDETTVTIFGQTFPLGCVAGNTDFYGYAGILITLHPWTVAAA